MIRIDENDGLEPIAADSMTPMIDVILSLIAFMMLMINAPLLMMEVDLPDVREQEYNTTAEGRLINLEILNAAEQWRLDGELILSTATLEAELQRQVIESEIEVLTVITIDQASAAQRMIDTLDVLNRLGIENAEIALESKSGE